MKKNIGIVIVIVVVAGLAWWMFSSKKAVAPVSPEQPIADTTAKIQTDLQGLDTGNLDAEFQSIDTDLGKL